MPTYLDLNSVRPAENAGLFLSQAPGTPITRLVVNSSGEPDPNYTQHPGIIGGERCFEWTK